MYAFARFRRGFISALPPFNARIAPILANITPAGLNRQQQRFYRRLLRRRTAPDLRQRRDVLASIAQGLTSLRLAPAAVD